MGEITQVKKLPVVSTSTRYEQVILEQLAKWLF